MRLLLTRAPEDAARTRRRLEAAGHEVVLAPVIRIVPLPVPWPRRAVDAVVASSAHAFAGLAQGAAPAREARRLVPLLLVGGRTLEEARAKGFGGEAVVAADAAGLAAVIAGWRRRAAYRAVYLAGRDRKEDIERALEAAGADLILIEAYEARAADALPTPSTLRAGDGVLHYSRRSAELFVGLAGRAGLGAETLRHFCLSADAAAPLVAAGCPDVAVADAPSETSLLALLGPAPPDPAFGGGRP